MTLALEALRERELLLFSMEDGKGKPGAPRRFPCRGGLDQAQTYTCVLHSIYVIQHVNYVLYSIIPARDHKQCV